AKTIMAVLPAWSSRYASSVHSYDIDLGSSVRASSDITSMARPELTPGRALPLIDAAGYMLYRVRTSGPLTIFTSATAPMGTIVPELFRTRSRRMSSSWSRYLASAWQMTCQVRPNRLKSLTYSEPR